MKKVLGILLGVLLVIGALGGCSSEQGVDNNSQTINLRFPTASTTGAVYPLGRWLIFE